MWFSQRNQSFEVGLLKLTLLKSDIVTLLPWGIVIYTEAPLTENVFMNEHVFHFHCKDYQDRNHRPSL